MSQRDCGCGGLVTPSLDELLAVAQGKPLPRVRVRDRRPPPAKVNATLKGWMAWRLVDRKGREVRGGEGPNLILDQGLDEIAVTALVTEQGDVTIPTFFPIIRYCAVGTDSTSPDPSQAGLGTEIARTGNTYATEEITRPSPGAYRLTRYIEFDYSVANGNLTEWGFSSSGSAGSNLFNRALFTDDEGDPDPVTKTDQEKLRVIYTLEISLSPVDWVEASFDITGLGTVEGRYRLVGASAPTSPATSNNMRCVAPDLKWFSAMARGEMGDLVTASQRPSQGNLTLYDADLSGATYTYATNINVLTSRPYAANEVGEARHNYVSGSFERTGGKWFWDTPFGNLTEAPAIVGIGSWESFNSGLNSCGPLAGYIFAVDSPSPITKDDEHSLTIGCPTVSWGRGSS